MSVWTGYRSISIRISKQNVDLPVREINLPLSTLGIPCNSCHIAKFIKKRESLYFSPKCVVTYIYNSLKLSFSFAT